MFPDRQPRSFLDASVLSRLARRAVVRPPADAGQRLGPARQPASRLERRVRRVSQVRARRRPAAARLAGLRPLRSLLREGVRGRHEPALLPGRSTPAARWASARPASRRSSTPGGSPARSAIWPCSRATRSACRAWPTGIVRNDPAAAQPGPPDGRSSTSSEQAKPQGRDAARAGAARAGRDDPPAGARSSSSPTCSSTRASCAAASSTSASASTTWPSFHLLDPLELSFNFHRPMRFLDMEGGPADLRRAERDRRPLPQGDRRATCDELQQVVLRVGRRLPPRQHRRGLRAGAACASSSAARGRGGVR